MGKKDRSQDKSDRLSIDLMGRRWKIEQYRDDDDWKERPITAKIRKMIDDAFAYRHGDRRSLDEDPPKIAQLISDHWQAITEAGLDITGKRLQEMKGGARPEDGELIELATVLPYDAERLIEIRKRDFCNGQGQGNGQPTAKL